MSRTIAAVAAALAIGLGAGLWIGGEPRTEQDHVNGKEAGVYRCPMHPTIVAGQPGSCPVCGMDLVSDAVPEPPASKPSGERVIAYWRAPMDPNYISESPGKSPMGMDLTPVYEDEPVAAGMVQIDPVTVQNIGVRTAAVERRRLSRNVRTVGRVDYDETRMSDVNTKVAGWVERLHVDYTGQRVVKGQELLEIFSPELVAAQEEYLTALDYQKRLKGSTADVGAQSFELLADAVAGAKNLVSAAAQRLRYWDITAAQIDELARTRAVKRRMTIYSPQEGIVVHKAVFDGAHIKPGEHLYRIGDLSTVWVYADIYEFELPWIRAGQQAAVDLAYLPGKTFAGNVNYVYPFLDAKTRTVKVRMSFPNPDLDLKPEMYANVEITSTVAHDALVVPDQAVIRSGERNVVLVALGDGRFQPRDVRLGVETDGVVQALDGLREGERIVVSGQFLIDSESNLKAALQDMTTAAEAMGRGGHTDHQSASARRGQTPAEHPDKSAHAEH